LKINKNQAPESVWDQDAAGSNPVTPMHEGNPNILILGEAFGLFDFSPKGVNDEKNT